MLIQLVFHFSLHTDEKGPEILDAFRGERLDYFVTGWGTGGTLTGTSKVLRAARPGIKSFPLPHFARY